MSAWTQRVADNVLPVSIAKTLPEAFKEWRFTGGYEDHGTPVETCQLCEQEELRYHFEIANDQTERTLWVGSVCILRFQIAIYEDGQQLDEKQARRHLDRLIQKMQHEACIKALERLAASETNSILSGALDYYKRNGFLTPKQANVIAWRLHANRIEHHPSFFKVALRRDSHKEDLRKMPLARVHRIWPYLSPAQRKLAQRLGHTPPQSDPISLL